MSGGSLETSGPGATVSPVKMSRRDSRLPVGSTRIPGKGSPVSYVATQTPGDHPGGLVPGDSLLLERSSSWCQPYIRLHSLSTCSPGTLTVKHLIPSPLSSWRPHPSPQPAGHLSTGPGAPAARWELPVRKASIQLLLHMLHSVQL